MRANSTREEPQSAEERLVERRLAVRRERGETAVVLHPLQEVVHFDVRVAVVAVVDLGALAEQCVRLVEEETAPLRSAASKIAWRFFSVSPTCLFTTPVRSMRSRSRSRWPAGISTAIVFPVTLGPRRVC